VSYTKIDLVKSALSEVGLSSYLFDLSVDQMSEALCRLDLMMAEWGGRGIRLGYQVASTPAGVDAMTDSGIPDWAHEAVITNLAVRLAPAYGKTVQRETSIIATRGMNTLLALAAKPREMQLGPLPFGAGAKRDEPFMPVLDDGVVHNPEETVILDRSPR